MSRRPQNGAAFVYAKAVTVRPPDNHPGESPFLLVHLMLDCSDCGEATMLIAGHHLRAVVRVLQQVIDSSEPELTVEGETEIVQRRFERPFRAENN